MNPPGFFMVHVMVGFGSKLSCLGFKEHSCFKGAGTQSNQSCATSHNEKAD